MTGKGETHYSTEVGTVRSLQYTPTWAVATVCFIFITVSIILERLINLLSTRLKKNRKKSLIEAVEKLKSVLVVLGFMSLMLNVTEGGVSKICIPTNYANRLLPCDRIISAKSHDDVEEDDDHDHHDNNNNFLNYCFAKGKTSLMSEEGVTQLSYFFFVLACMHILYNLATFLLGMAKMRRWKSWEKESQTVDYLTANDPNRFRITRDTTFARRHLSTWTETWIQLWIKCFFRQFSNSVAKVDYLTLRHGFITAHLPSNNSFNFQKYIQRSLHDDFKTVVGISPFMWLTVVIFMLLDVHGWRVYFYMAFVPLINTFEMAFFVWITWQFGINSCYHEHREIIITRIVLAVTVQVLSGYITLPLYALVTQMGSSYKRAIFEEQVTNALRQWHDRVRAKRKQGQTPRTELNDVTPRTENEVSNDIDSEESPIQLEVVSNFRLGRQPPILQEISIVNKSKDENCYRC